MCPDGGQPTPCEPQNDLAAFKPEGPVPSRLALGGRGAYSGRCWGSPVRQKKKHTGKALLCGACDSCLGCDAFVSEAYE